MAKPHKNEQFPGLSPDHFKFSQIFQVGRVGITDTNANTSLPTAVYTCIIITIAIFLSES